MKSLLLLRHAKSSWREPDMADHDRPLKKRGLRDAPKIGALLAERGLVPDLIVSSTARRAADTARIVAESAGYEGEVRHAPSLYLASPSAILAQIAGASEHARRVMIVGHNPDLEELLEQLTGENAHMPTGALAVIELDVEAWAEVGEATRGKLLELVRPKEI